MQEAQPRSYHQTEYSRRPHSFAKEKGPLQEQSIFNFYSVANEVSFDRDLSVHGLSQSERDFYKRENLYRFLGEFAGHVPYTTISYVLKDDGLYYGDINTSSVYEATAQMTDSGSREWAEYEGHQNTLSLLAQHNEPIVAFSPPKIADYSFAFVWTKGEYDEALGGTPVTMQAVRYDEPMESVAATANAARQLVPGANLDIFPNANSYIANPFVVDSSVGIKDIMRAVGVDSSGVDKSRLFEERVRHELAPYANAWTQAVEEAASTEPGTIEHTRHMSRLETMLEGIFNMATNIHNGAAHQEWNNYAPTQHTATDQERQYMMLAAYAHQKPATVSGGGSCPVVASDKSSNGLRYEFQNNRTIEQILHRGIGDSQEGSIRYDNYNCPHCKGTIQGELKGKQEDWTTNCPHCAEVISCRAEEAA